MNKWQRVVLVVGLVVAMGLALFPPWQYVRPGGGGPLYRGRAFVLSDRHLDPKREPSRHRHHFVAWSRVAMEQFIVWVPTVAIVLLLRRKR